MATHLTLADIESFEYVDDVCEVFDIEVDDTHCYHLDVGRPILVHNSTKTWSILQLLVLWAVKQPDLTISVVSESLPHIKKGALKDFKTILKTEGLTAVVNEHKTDVQFTFPNGTVVEFFGADSAGKVHGSRRDVLFLNECNNLKFQVAEQLEIRTRIRVFYDYNPTESFWVHKNILTLPSEDVTFIQSTYKDNVWLPSGIIKSIESRVPVYRIGGIEITDWKGEHYGEKGVELVRGNPEWWRVYALGDTGTVEGRIIKSFKLIDNMPMDDNGQPLGTPYRVGLDFGFTNDPAAMVELTVIGDDVYVNELMYERGMTNPMIAQRCFEQGHNRSTTIIADSAEPKSITELNNAGLNVTPAQKGVDSVRHGIEILQRYRFHVTKTSTNWIREARAYKYKYNQRTDEWFNVPADGQDDHLMDATRYVLQQTIAPSSGALTEMQW